jgi:hypothetical protein
MIYDFNSEFIQSAFEQKVTERSTYRYDDHGYQDVVLMCTLLYVCKDYVFCKACNR